MSRRTVVCLAAALAASPDPSAAQQTGLPIKTGIGASSVGGCSAFSAAPFSPSPQAPNADAEARRLIAEAEEAVLQGEHATARDAFARAAALVPSNSRVAYYLGREHEALRENTPAVRQYCRYLALSPAAADADEVRGRIVRLTPASDLARVDEARANFRSGVALLQRRQYTAADSAFAAVSRQVPAAPEPYFNRALARAARGTRAPAMQDFERYLELAPQAADRQAVRNAMSRLQDRVYGPGQAFGSGLIVPGLGQMNTGRPVLGVVALGTVAGALAIALKTSLETRSYTDPFGNPYSDVVPARPNAGTWVPIAGVLWIGAALEAMRYARHSRSRAEAIIAPEPTARGVSLIIPRLPHRRIGVGVSLGYTR